MEIGQNDWNDKLTELHKLLREGNLKEFHSLFNRMTKVKQGNSVVRGIVNEEGIVIMVHEEVDSMVYKYFNQAMNNLVSNPASLDASMKEPQPAFV